METQFAPAERSSREEIEFQNSQIKMSGLIATISESTNTVFMILNNNRQIVYANQELLDMLNSSCGEILGLRPGEVFGCINSVKTEGGCGTHEFCRECGAVQAILEALKGNPCKRECRITSVKNGENISYDLSVKAYPFENETLKEVLVSVMDISDTKRREILERTFFHDLLNTAAGLHGASFLLLRKLCDPESDLYDKANIIYECANTEGVRNFV